MIPMLKQKIKKLTEKGAERTMRRSLFGAFILFSAAVLAFLWIFQSIFMNSVYRGVRTFETVRCGTRLKETQPDEIEERAQELSEKYNICISVYLIEAGRGTEVVKSHTNTFCFIHNTASDFMLNQLYSEAKGSGKNMREISLSGDERKDEKDGSGIIYTVLSDSESEGEYMFLLNTEIYPLSSTVSTMRLMLVFVSVFLVVSAAILSSFVSSKMSRPAVEMSMEASHLALGNYDVHFDGGNYKELCDLADALNRAAEELSRLDGMQKDLIANISHDLRTPLTMIAGYSEVVRDIPGENTPENMQIIIDETNRLASLVNDMLDLSRLISGTQKLNISEFSLTEAVRETVSRYSKLREREGYTLDFEYDCEAEVRADKTRILQVLYNLINNAVNYTGADKRVLIKQKVTGNTCRIEVIDHGCGIAEDELPMIWERYYKSKEFHKRSQIGTGLGLSIVKNILVLHGASFGVKSKKDCGSNFWFELNISKISHENTLNSGENLLSE